MMTAEATIVPGFFEDTSYGWEPEEGPIKSVSIQHNHQTAKYCMKPRDSFSFIDLFAGIGGLRRGFEAVGGKCVFSSEWNKFSVQTYLANNAHDHEIAGDIREVPAHVIPAHDVMLAGFPCQPFSIAGVSKKKRTWT